MKILYIALALILNLPVLATSVGTEIMDCPACGHGYQKTVILSWNFNMSGGKGPPQPSGTCPHCLFTWQGSPKNLSADALTRQNSGLDAIRRSFRAKDRGRLFQSTGMHPGDAENRLLRHSQWILTGKKPLGEMKWPFSSTEKKLSKDAKDARAEALAIMKRIQNGGESADVIRKDLERVSIGYIEDSLRIKDRSIQVFTITWLLWTTDSDLLNSQYCLTDIAGLLKAMPDEHWPELTKPAGEKSARADSLAYLRGKGQWTASMDQVLRDSEQHGLQCWLLACASACHDRKLAPWLASQIKKESGWQLCEAAEGYYFNVGNVNDLRDLEKAHDFWLKLERKRKSSWEVSTSAVGHIETVMSIVRLKLIGTTPPEKTPDATILRIRKK